MGRKPKQLPIPGTEDEKNTAIEAAAEEYIDARDARMARTEDEVATKDKLIALMHKQNRTTYRRGELTIQLMPSEKVKVRKKGEDPKPKKGEFVKE